MKRGGPLRRKTPLSPGTKGLKRTGRLQPISKQKRREDRENKPMLDAYRREFESCERCGRNPGTDIHEVLAGPSRRRARATRSLVLHLCRVCHDALQNAPKPVQLAVKLASDPVGFNLRECLEVWGRAPTAILIDEVLIHMPRNLPSASELESDLRDVGRHIELLRRQLADKEVRQQVLAHELKKAQARERAIAAARLTGE